MKHIKPIVKCTCQYCGFKWEFTAKSKADAARMTGPATCGKQECRAKEDERLSEWVKSIVFVDAITGKAIDAKPEAPAMVPGPGAPQYTLPGIEIPEDTQLSLL